MTIEQQKFPIGKLYLPEIISEAQRSEAIETLRGFPQQLRSLTFKISEEQLSTPYREGGWTIKQLIHHIADSHNHCYNRVRWTLSEDAPTIKAYDQDAYAAMDDYKIAPIELSLLHIEVIHQKLVYIFQSMDEQQWSLHFVHPETNAAVTLKEMALTYAWHSLHHFAHIKNAL